MNAPTLNAALMSGQDYRESLRRLHPNVFVDGRQVRERRRRTGARTRRQRPGADL